MNKFKSSLFFIVLTSLLLTGCRLVTDKSSKSSSVTSSSSASISSSSSSSSRNNNPAYIFEYSLSQDGTYYNVIARRDRVFGDITIPETYAGKPVRTVSGFNDCVEITSVHIPKTITQINSNCFAGCTSLKSFTVDENNKDYSAADGVLYNKNKTTLVIFPAANRTGAFTVPDTVTSIKALAFYGSILTNVIVPLSVTSIGDRAFRKCDLLESITLPFVGKDLETAKDKNNSNVNTGNLGYIFEGSLYYADGTLPPASLKEVILQEGCPGVSKWGFLKFSNLQSVTLPSTIEFIGQSAFMNCSSLKSIKLPNGVTSIGNGAFSNCTSLESINIPNSVTEIDNNAFINCTSLKSITIPNSDVSIGSGILKGCTSLEEITIPTTKNSSSTALFGFFSSANDIPETLKKINLTSASTIVEEKAFFDFSNVETIELPSNITEIGSQAFYNCSSLKSITIPSTVTSIGTFAFMNCTSLKEIVIPKSVLSIEASAFVNCASLESITLSEGLTSIGSGAFYNCTSLKSITLPESLTYIGSNAFSGCASLKEIVIPRAVTYIGVSAFEGCTSLESITTPLIHPTEDNYKYFYSFFRTSSNDELPPIKNITIYEGVTEILIGFDYFEYLETIRIPNSVVYIGARVFNNCPSLKYNEYNGGLYLGNETNPYILLIKPSSRKITDFTVHNDCKFLYSYAFGNCSSLINISLPNGLLNIGMDAFFSCDSLETIFIPGTVKELSVFAFDYCKSLTSIYFGGTMEEWAEVNKRDGWHDHTPATEVHCSDGDVSI